MKPLVLVLCGDVRETMEKFTKCPCAVSRYSEARIYTALCDYKIYRVTDDPHRLMGLVVHGVLLEDNGRNILPISDEMNEVLAAGLRRGERRKCT